MIVGGVIGAVGVLLFILGSFAIMAGAENTGTMMLLIGLVLGAAGLIIMVNFGLVGYLIEEMGR